MASTFAAALIAAACGVGPAHTARTLGGSITGLKGTGLVLQFNGGADITIDPGATTFKFDYYTADGWAYEVTVLTQPTTPSQTCKVENGSGTTDGADVTSVEVICTTNTYTVGGSVSGLLGNGAGLVLQLNGGEKLPVAVAGNFAFSAKVESGAAYSVIVATQPANPAQTCSLSDQSGTGTVGGADVGSVSVVCSLTSFTIGGSVAGLRGSGLVLDLNGQEQVTVAAYGDFSFKSKLASGTSYIVAVATQPTNPSQTCRVENGSGISNGADVTSVAVSCTTNTYTIGGSVSGLLGNGAGLVLELNDGAEKLAVDREGKFAFLKKVESGASYRVKVFTDPTMPAQTCGVPDDSGTGTVGASDVESISVVCAGNPFHVGGIVQGLTGSGLQLTLKTHTGSETITTSNNGVFMFQTKLVGMDAYLVEVTSSPSSETCSPVNGKGIGAGTDVTNVIVICSTSSHRVGVTVTGLTGNGLKLSLNGPSTLDVSQDGTFWFKERIASGAGFLVTVDAQPTKQGCSIQNATGTVGNADIEVAVSCGRHTWTNDVVTDHQTGYFWQRAVPPSRYTWSEAPGYCAKLGQQKLGGFSDWRLPTLDELKSIVAPSKQNPSIDEGAFPNTPSAAFWTSTPRASDTSLSFGWVIYFSYGNSGDCLTTLQYWVRCVR